MGKEQQGKILKVTLEYEGITYIAEKEDAEQWLQWINNIEFLAAALGRFSDFKWTKIEEHKDAKGSDKGS